MLERQEEGLKTRRVFLLKDEGRGRRTKARSEATQAVITVLQVLVALVAAGVSWGVSREAAPVQEQLLLGASRLAAPLRVAAACEATGVNIRPDCTDTTCANLIGTADYLSHRRTLAAAPRR